MSDNAVAAAKAKVGAATRAAVQSELSRLGSGTLRLDPGALSGPSPLWSEAGRFTAFELTQSGFAYEDMGDGNLRVHLLLSDFAVGSANLTSHHIMLLHLLRLPILLNDSFRLEMVAGSASQTGPETGGGTTNQTLARERAAAVSSFLVFELGLDLNKTLVESFGSTRPLVDVPDTEAALNRSVLLTYVVRFKWPEPPSLPEIRLPFPMPTCAVGTSKSYAFTGVLEYALDIPLPQAKIIKAVSKATKGAIEGQIKAYMRTFTIEIIEADGTRGPKRDAIEFGGAFVGEVNWTKLRAFKNLDKLKDALGEALNGWTSLLIPQITTVVNDLTTPVQSETCVGMEAFDQTLVLSGDVMAGVGVAVSESFMWLPAVGELPGATSGGSAVTAGGVGPGGLPITVSGSVKVGVLMLL